MQFNISRLWLTAGGLFPGDAGRSTLAVLALILKDQLNGCVEILFAFFNGAALAVGTAISGGDATNHAPSRSITAVNSFRMAEV